MPRGSRRRSPDEERLAALKFDIARWMGERSALDAVEKMRALHESPCVKRRRETDDRLDDVAKAAKAIKSVLNDILVEPAFEDWLIEPIRIVCRFCEDGDDLVGVEPKTGTPPLGRFTLATAELSKSNAPFQPISGAALRQAVLYRPYPENDWPLRIAELILKREQSLPPKGPPNAPGKHTSAIDEVLIGAHNQQVIEPIRSGANGDIRAHDDATPATKSSDVSSTRVIDNLWEMPRTVLHGRDHELAHLRSFFTGEEQAGDVTAPHVISGEAGMGKSALACEVAADVASNYAARWWIDAESQLKARAGLRELARRFGIRVESPTSEGTDDDHSHQFLTALHDLLASNALAGRLLLILDNVDDPQLKRDLPSTILRYLPATACDVLITSQSNAWHPLAMTQTRLSGLELDTAATLVAIESDRAEAAEDDDVIRICQAFDGRPLFLKPFAAMMRDGARPADFLARLRTSAEDAIAVLPDSETFNPLLSVTYTLAIGRADSAHPGSRALLETMSFLSGEPIPQGLLHATASPQQDWSPAVDRALATLTDRSLIERSQESNTEIGYYVLHRAVAAVVRTAIRESDRPTLRLHAASFALARSMPTREELSTPHGHSKMSVLEPHIAAVAGHLLRERVKSESLLFGEAASAAAAACSMLGVYRRSLSEWNAAQEAHEIAVQLSDAESNPGALALRQVQLANVMRQRGQFDSAQSILDIALPNLETFGELRDYAWGLTVLARVLRNRPDTAVADALSVLQDAMALLQKSPLEDNATIRQRSELDAYLSGVHRQLSDYGAAEREALQGLCLVSGGIELDDLLGDANPPLDALVAKHLRALAALWRLNGDFARAMRGHTQALWIFEQLYGADNTDVGRMLDSLGRVQREWGDLEGALASFSRAAEISNARFGPDYPHAGTAAVNIALAYRERSNSDLANALNSANEGLRIYCKAYGESYDRAHGGALRNDSTAWAVFVRADVLSQTGDIEIARCDHENVLSWRTSHYREEHALTASSYFALGNVLLRFGDEDLTRVGVEHHRTAYEIRRRVFGDGLNYWLAQSQAALGELTRDVTMLSTAYETFRLQLREGHPRTQRVLATLEILDPQHEHRSGSRRGPRRVGRD